MEGEKEMRKIVYLFVALMTIALIAKGDVTISSNGIQMNVYPQLVITKQPTGQAKLIGETAIFSVLYNGGGTAITYQWHKGATPLTNGGKYTGADTLTLTITGVDASDVDDYWLEITDSYPGGAQVVNSNVGHFTLLTNKPTLTLTYNTASPTTMTCSQNSGDMPLEILCPGNGSWTTASISQMGLWLYEAGTKPRGNVTPAPMTATGDFTFTLNNASLSGFNGKIVPFFWIGTSKYLSWQNETVVLIKNGVITTLTPVDGYYPLDLR